LLVVLGALWVGCSALVAAADGAPSSAADRIATPAGANRIAIDAPDGAKARKPYNITLHGFARRSATAFLFVDYLGCAKSLRVERQRARNASYSYAVKGDFAKVSGWKSSTAGVDHACAYLVAFRSGTLLAAARMSFQIARRHR